jgi:hypothetical protein
MIATAITLAGGGEVGAGLLSSPRIEDEDDDEGKTIPAG